MSTEIIIRSTQARTGGKYGNYRNLALMVVDKGTRPVGISTRYKCVHEVLRETGPLNVGKTDKCAYQVCLTELKELAVELGYGEVRVVR